MVIVPCLAAAIAAAPVSRLEIDENRHMIVTVTLHAPGPPVLRRRFRFALDTGSARTLVDRGVPEAFLRPDPCRAGVLLRRLEVAGLVQDCVPADRIDLKGGPIGSFQDRPVDGILGMSYLEGKRFTLDPARRELRWWEAPFAGTPVRLERDGQGRRYLAGRADAGPEAPYAVDTGSARGVQLPASVQPSPVLGPELYHDALGVARPLGVYQVGCLRFGTVHLDQVRAEADPEDPIGYLGQDLWSAAPACFDFVTDQLTFSAGPGGALPCAPAPRPLAVRWEREDGRPRLVVGQVVPGGFLDRLGCRPGDEILRAGDLEGGRLTRAALQAQARGPGPWRWRVRRAGRVVALGLE